ncbi:MAG TPA: alpha-ribazole phosphatase [Paraburkholderia sp.]|jgi:alpha-ribazole phosphatase|nr:alpha-ribazole phosphatase [Paraburkholderia sp.]
MDVVLIRHPAVAVAPGVCYGSSDVPLADAPAAASGDIGARLAALRAPPPQRIVTSPLGRCARVADALASAHGLDARPDARLAEMDFGAWELTAWDAIAREQIDAWAADLLHAREHGGESVAQFDARVQAGFDALTGDADAESATWVVTHSGVIRAIAARSLGVPLERCLRWPLEMAAIVWLRRDAPGGAWDEWRLVRWNV